MRLEEAAERFVVGYFSTCRRSLKTQVAYRMDLTQFGAYFGKAKALESIGVEGLERWAAELTARQYASASIRRKFATLRVFYSYWVRKGELDSSPLWKIRLDLECERRLPRGLTGGDAKRLIELAWLKIGEPPLKVSNPADSRFRALRNLAVIELLFATGVRVGELVSLTLGDWREEDASFLVKGKGFRQRLAVLPDARSVAAFKKYFAKRLALNLDHGAIFVNASGAGLSTQGVARVLARLAEEAQIEERVTPHVIRHTVATLLLRYGADIRVVQEILGHSSITMTERYTHVSKEHLRSTLNAHHPNYHLGIRTGSNWREHAGTPAN
jgi:site-specific recombinase XerD